MDGRPNLDEQDWVPDAAEQDAASLGFRVQVAHIATAQLLARPPRQRGDRPHPLGHQPRRPVARISGSKAESAVDGTPRPSCIVPKTYVPVKVIGVV